MYTPCMSWTIQDGEARATRLRMREERKNVVVITTVNFPSPILARWKETAGEAHDNGVFDILV